MLISDKVKLTLDVSAIKRAVSNWHYGRVPPLALISADARGVALGLAVDAAIGDPRKGHPVAAFGVVAGRLESMLWRDSRLTGAVYCGVCVAGPVLLGVAASRLPARTAVVAAATWAVVGGTTLAPRGRRGISAALAVGRPGRGPAPPARPWSDATRRRCPPTRWPAPWSSRSPRTPPTPSSRRCSGARSPGCPGCSATARSTPSTRWSATGPPRYERFGWASARLDDVANWLPARLTGVLAVVLAPLRRRLADGRVARCCAATAGATRAPTPAGARRRSPALSDVTPGRPQRLRRPGRGAAVDGLRQAGLGRLTSQRSVRLAHDGRADRAACSPVVALLRRRR